MSKSKQSSSGPFSIQTDTTVSKKLVVIGLGYIGLPTATMFARSGLEVVGVDVNQTVVDTINRGCTHIVENGLETVVNGVIHNGRLRAATKPVEADAFLICVPTPVGSGHTPDLGYVEAATCSIAPFLRPGNLVILESTSPVGTTGRMARILADLRPDLRFPQQSPEQPDVHLAYCPERVLPGRILEELVNNDRVVGGLTPACAQRAAALYQLFVKGECLLTTADTAELVKLTENAYRDVCLAFANEMSVICGELGINVWELIRLANRHPRVDILRPGPGVGGHCIAVDPWFIVHSSRLSARLIRTARQVNDDKPFQVVDLVRQAAGQYTAPTIACLGLSYKANIDDLRESPAVEVVSELAHLRLGRLVVVEPFIQKLPAVLAGKTIDLLALPAALDAADIVVLLVDHQVFASVTAEQLQGKTVVDTRGLWNQSAPHLATVVREQPRSRAA